MKSLAGFFLTLVILVLTLGKPGAQPPTYTLSPKSLPAHGAVTLTVRSSAYDSCHYVFTHTSLTLSNGTITASFVPVNDTVCSAVVRPYGPTIPYAASSGLAAGKYPVYATLHMACEYTVPVCPVVAPIPVFVDTLVVYDFGDPVLLKPRGYAPAFLMPNDWGLVHGYWLNGRRFH